MLLVSVVTLERQSTHVTTNRGIRSSFSDSTGAAAEHILPRSNVHMRCADKFADVQNAYEILSDDSKRQDYDRFGHSAVDGSMGERQQPGAGGDGEFMAAEEIFERFFGTRPGGRARARWAPSARPARPASRSRVALITHLPHCVVVFLAGLALAAAATCKYP